MKKIGRILSLLLLLGAAGAAFYLGWAQFKVTTESCGVLISKTSGVEKKPIVPGVFSWHWQLLIPTNATIRVFSMAPYVNSVTKSGQLPSADMYKQLLLKDAEFSYSYNITLGVRFTPDGIVQQVSLHNIQNDDEMQKLLKSVVDQACDVIVAYIAEQAMQQKDFSVALINQKDVMSYLSALPQFSDIVFTQCNVEIQTVPDMYTYTKAKEAFEAYQKRLEEKLTEQAEVDATMLAQDSRDMAKLAKLGELLRQYPELSEILKNSSVTEALRSVRNIQ
ncbi:MAG: hypothetical protein K6E51_07595 [Treponema sp.]|nr:hypothetical protein [Treponema sp.]